MFQTFPEMLLVDATYKLLNLRLPVYLLVNIDGDGQSEIVALFILGDETKTTVEEMVKVFKKHNEAWSKCRVIMSDKDFVEREAFTSCFPDAQLLICMYHTLRSFRREVTCEKMGITSGERNRCLEIIQKIAYSFSETDYNNNVQMLHNTKFQTVITYFEKNWNPIKEQWVHFFKNRFFNLGETTNNRIESTFNKLKSVCSKHSSLMQFFVEFFTFLGAIRNDRHHHHLMSLTRKDISKLENPVEQAFYEQLTPYAFSRLKPELQSTNSNYKYERVDASTFRLVSSTKTYNLTHQSCNCSFMTKMGLPCRHLLQLRSFLSLPLYDETLSNHRWTKTCYLESLDKRIRKLEEPSDTQVHFTTMQDETASVTKTKNLSQAEKFRLLMKKCQVLASLGSEGGIKTFTHRKEQLELIIEQWQKNNEIFVTTEKKHSNTENTKTLENKYISHEMPKQEIISEIQRETNKIAHDNPTKTAIDVNEKHQANSNISSVVMPPKLQRKGRPRGADTTAIGLPQTKKSKSKGKSKPAPFSKLTAQEKDRVILNGITDAVSAEMALEGKKLLKISDLKGFNIFSDALRDENISITRIEHFFEQKD